MKEYIIIDHSNEFDGMDYPELVRCKDCKYAHIRTEYERNNGAVRKSEILCERLLIGINSDFHCGYGERREE